MDFDTTQLERRYSSLRLVSNLLRVIAWINIVASFFFGFALYSMSSNSANSGLGILMFIGSVVLGIIIGIGLLASAESIRVLIDIEENTRFVAMGGANDNSTELLTKILIVLENIRNQKIDNEI